MRDFAIRLISGLAVCLLCVYFVVANHAVKHRQAAAREERREAADFRYLHNKRQEVIAARRTAASSSPNLKAWDYHACVEALGSQEGEERYTAIRDLGRYALEDRRALAKLFNILETGGQAIRLRPTGWCGTSNPYDPIDVAAQKLLRLGLRSSEIALPLAGVASDSEHYPTLSRHLAAKYLRYCMIDSSARSVVIDRLRGALDDEFWGVRVAARCTMEIRGWEYHRPDNLTVVELCEGEDFRDRDPPGGLK